MINLARGSNRKSLVKVKVKWTRIQNWSRNAEGGKTYRVSKICSYLPLSHVDPEEKGGAVVEMRPTPVGNSSFRDAFRGLSRYLLDVHELLIREAVVDGAIRTIRGRGRV
jgi:hypothetical protein